MGKKTKYFLLLVLFIVMTYGIAFGFYVFHVYREKKSGLLDQAGSIQLGGQKYEVKTQDSYWFGSANPKVTIIEFSDFACVNSKNSFPTIRELVTKYKKDVKYVFKDYPQFDESLDLAEAARCAGEQGLFWPMHDKLFINQGIASEEGIFEAAKQVGASEDRFKKCFQDKKYQTQIGYDTSEGDALNLDGTPTWIINGYMVKGDIPASVWDKLIKQLLE